MVRKRRLVGSIPKAVKPVGLCPLSCAQWRMTLLIMYYRVKVKRMINDKSCKSSQVIFIDGIVCIYIYKSVDGS